jgi:integrase
MPRKMGRPRADVSWPKPFCDMSYRLDRLERWALGRAIKETDGGPVDVEGVLAVDEAAPFDKVETRITFLTNVIAALQKVGGFDVAPIAMRLAKVRAKKNAANAAGNPKPEKADILEQIPGWPATYAAHWRQRLFAMNQSLNSKLQAELADSGVDAKNSRRSSLLNTRSAFNRLIAFCEQKGFKVETTDIICVLWLDDLIRARCSLDSCASYLSRVGNLAKEVEGIDDRENVWLHTATTLREKADQEIRNYEEPQHPAELAKKGLKMIRQARRSLKTGEDLPQECARLFRDGLIVILLALYPLRRHNCAPLEFGNNLVKIGSSWFIDLPPDQTKEANQIRFRLAPWLVSIIMEWRRAWLPILLAGPTNFLFATHLGETLSMAQLTTIVKDRTGSTCHGFRHAAATMIAEETDRDSDATQVLWHKDGRTRILYSRTAECLRAGGALAAEIAKVQRRLAKAA